MMSSQPTLEVEVMLTQHLENTKHDVICHFASSPPCVVFLEIGVADSPYRQSILEGLQPCQTQRSTL